MRTRFFNCVQMRERERQAADMMAEASKPFARTKDDVDKELNLKGTLPAFATASTLTLVS